MCREVEVFFAVIIVALALFVGMYVGDLAGEGRIQRQAIERGVARYSPTTGEWEWIPHELADQGHTDDG